MFGRVNGGGTRTFIRDADNRVKHVTGAATGSFDCDGGKPVTATTSGTTTFYVGNYYEKTGTTVRKYYYHGGRRVAMRENGVLSWLLTDQLGSTAMTLTASAAITGELRYKAYGETRYTYGAPSTKYRFTGQREESTIGLYFYNARWYDAVLGRFVQADTVVPQPGNPQSLNRYSYALNNPLRYTDSSGHYVDEGSFWLQPGCSYDPSLAYYMLWAAGGSVRVDTYFLSPSASKDIFGVAVPQRVSVGTVVALSDPNNIGPLLMAVASGLSGMAANAPMPQVTTQIQAPSFQLPDIYGDPGFGPAEDAATGPPNPYGSRGGPSYSSVVENIESDIAARGLTPETEYQVNLQGPGTEGRQFRRVDVAALDVNGSPIARELRAIIDITEFTQYTHVPLHFWGKGLW